MNTSKPRAEHAAEATEPGRTEAYCAAFRAAIDFFRLDAGQAANAAGDVADTNAVPSPASKFLRARRAA